MDYSHFEIEDFASDDTFIEWVLHRESGATRFWENYRMQHPELEHKIDEARSLLLTLRSAEQKYHDPADHENIWRNIQGRITEKPAEMSFSFLRIAASLSILVLLSAFILARLGYFSGSEPLSQATSLYEDHLPEVVNTTDHTMVIDLSDGTRVSLEPRSRLKYAADFKEEPYRKVYLTGEAFFDVAKNLQQPFFVYANEVVTKVLGTSFRVKAYDEDRDIVVSVKEGKVSVYAEECLKKTQDVRKPELNGVILLPNQEVLYKRTEHSFNKTLVETPAVLTEPGVTYSFNFNNAAAQEVFDVLAAAYGVDIMYNDELMKNCYLTAPLAEEPLFEKLDIICRTLGASYELIDAKVVISTKGCSETAAHDANK